MSKIRYMRALAALDTRNTPHVNATAPLLAPRLCSPLGPPVRELLLEKGALLLLRVPLSLTVGVADEHGRRHACCGVVSCTIGGRSEAALSTQAPVWTVVDSCRASDRSPRAACAVASTRYAQRLLDEL